MSEQEPTYEQLWAEAWNTMSRLIAANKDNEEVVSPAAILHLGMFFAETSPHPSPHQMETGTSPFVQYRQLLRAYIDWIEEGFRLAWPSQEWIEKRNKLNAQAYKLLGEKRDEHGHFIPEDHK